MPVRRGAGFDPLPLHVTITNDEGDTVTDETFEPPEIEDADYADFDAAMAEADQAKPGRTAKIAGEVIELPKSLPLQFMLEQAKQQRLPQSKQDPIKLASILFPERLVKKWARAGMSLHHFAVLIAWAPAYIEGQNITPGEVAKMLAEQSGKA